MRKALVTFCDSLTPWHDSIHWATNATQLFQLANEVHGQCAVATGSDRPRHGTMLDKRVRCVERYVLADLLRLLFARHLHTPLYVNKLLPLVTQAGHVMTRCTSSGKIEITQAAARELNHVMAEMQAVLNEYGFSRALDILPDPEEAASRLDVLQTKIVQLEAAIIASAATPEGICVTLRTINAQMEGARQTLLEDVAFSLQNKCHRIGQTTDRILDLLISQHCGSRDSPLFKHYSDAEKMLQKSFVNSVYENSEAVASSLSSRVIQTGTRGWLIETVQKWLESPGYSSKTLFYITGQSGMGKTAASVAVCKVFSRELTACHLFDRNKRTDFYNTANGLVQCLASSMLSSLPAYLDRMNSKYGESDLKLLLSKSWLDSYNLLIRDPLRQIYGNRKPSGSGSHHQQQQQQRHLFVVDSLDECSKADWTAVKDFVVRFTSDLPASFCLLVTTQTKNLSQFITAPNDDHVTGIGLDDRAWINRHIKDIELYLAGSIGAVLSGEEQADTPSRAKSDESTMQNIVDELLKYSAGRFDYGIDLMGVFTREMTSSGQFLSSMKKATGQLRANRQPEFEDKLNEFAKSYRAYRDKEGRTVNVRVLLQCQFLMDSSRAAIVRTNLQTMSSDSNMLSYN